MLVLTAAGCGTKSEPADAGRVPVADVASNPPQRPETFLGDSHRSDAGSRADPPATLDRDSEIVCAAGLVERGNFDEAASALKDLLLVDPTDVEVMFHLANIEAARGNLEDAVETLGAIPEDHPEAGIPALGQAADWCVQLGLYDDAERRYAMILQRCAGCLPRSTPARPTAQPLGRRHEAAEHIRELCKVGNVRQDELHALIVLSDAMIGEPSRLRPPQRWITRPIGASGEARKLFTERRYAEAAEVASRYD